MAQTFLERVGGGTLQPNGQLYLQFYARSVADPGFPRGGCANPEGEGRQPTICLIFPENCMKMKKVWLRGGGGTSLAPPLDPPLQIFLQKYVTVFFAFNLVKNTVTYRYTAASVSRSLGHKSFPHPYQKYGALGFCHF